jgi:Flp pilus assembly protein protease CpaA
MVNSESSRGNRKERLFVTGLWLASGVVVVAGFLLRPLARFLGGPDLRLLGVIVIAVGVVLGICGWVGEKIIENGRQKSA